MDADAFIKLAESSDTISGDFDFTTDKKDTLMDRDFVGKKFTKCKIVGGDFLSGSFVNCTFDKVLFRESEMVGVSFVECHFVNCKFSNVECDFSLSNCKTDHLTISNESPEVANHIWNLIK